MCILHSTRKKQEKAYFYENIFENVLRVRKKFVPLHRNQETRDAYLTRRIHVMCIAPKNAAAVATMYQGGGKNDFCILQTTMCINAKKRASPITL